VNQLTVINVQPTKMRNGDTITSYTDTVGTVSQTFTFLTAQETVVLTNKGTKDISYTIGSQSGTLGRSESVKVTGSITFMTLSSEQGTQAFDVWADESGNNSEVGSGGGGNANIDDTTTSILKVWSSSKTQAQIQLIPKGDKGDTGAPGTATLSVNTVDLPHLTNLKDTNLFNAADQVVPNIVDGYYIGGGGTRYANANYMISSKIPVYPGLTLTVSDINSAGDVGAFYRADDTWISNTTVDTFTVPANASYMQLSILKSRPWAVAMLVVGSVLPNSFVPYGAKIKWLKVGSENLDKESVTSANIQLGTIKPYNVMAEGIRISNIVGVQNINLYNASEQVAPNIIDNSYIGGAGVLQSNVNYLISSKIYVQPNVTYTVSDVNAAADIGAFYKADDTWISNITTDTFTVPANCAYVRFSVNKPKNLSTVMLVVGSALPSIVLPYGAELNWLKLNTTQLALSGNRWFGKKINFLGDSITQGNQTSGTPYPDLVGQALGLSVVRNYGISGSTVGEGTGSANPYTLRYGAMDNDADGVIWSGGTNDIAYINNLGVMGDTVATSFYGALDVLIVGLINKYPDKLIVGMTPPRRQNAGYGSTLENYAIAVIAKCKEYGIPCLDMFNTFNMNPTLATQNTALYGDGIHQNAAGKQLIANKVAGFIRTQ
jgi:lysophospholipase L1-like esterase